MLTLRFIFEIVLAQIHQSSNARWSLPAQQRKWCVFKAEEGGCGDCRNRTLGQGFMFSQLTCPFLNTFSTAVCPDQCFRSVPKNPWLFPGVGGAPLGAERPFPAVLGMQSLPALPVSVTVGVTAALGHWWRAHMKLFKTSRTKKFFRLACANTGIIHGWERPTVLLLLLYQLETLLTSCLTNPP